MLPEQYDNLEKWFRSKRVREDGSMVDFFEKFWMADPTFTHTK